MGEAGDILGIREKQDSEVNKASRLGPGDVICSTSCSWANPHAKLHVTIAAVA